MKTLLISLLALIFATSCISTDQKNILDLSGEWSFQIDPESKGIIEKWFVSALPETINLPGSMTENGKGDEISVNTPWMGGIVDSSWFHSPDMEKYRQSGNIKVPFWLQPDKYYAGMAWYQKKVKIPASWKGRNIQLFLERCHWETIVWVDDRQAGMQNALGTPHIYDLTAWLTPGSHTLTLCVDNRVKEVDVGMNSHSISDHTQSNWNGITGRMELQSRNPVFISNATVYPDIKTRHANIKLQVQNNTGTDGHLKINITGESLNSDGHTPDSLMLDQQITPGPNEIDIKYFMGDDFLFWDEFAPNLYRMKIEVADAAGGTDVREVTFGMREFGIQGTTFTINGRPLFLRGTLECAIFPKTGYPPTDTASWTRIFRIARAHGLNHLRFHSWCPPEAAFTAADQAGFYLQIECSSWANQGSSVGDGKPVDQYIYDESERIVKSYGNHPSFCIMLYGNEPAGSNQEKWLTGFVSYWKNKDPRRLYSGGAGWPIMDAGDFNSTPVPRIQAWGEELNSIINAKPPQTNYDWIQKLPKNGKPTVSHEIGQWCVYPDFKEIAQYTGVLKARNFEIFQESLRKNNMEHLADSFLLASGKLQTLCYKADIEAALRTPGFAGFQLLDLHDFPGQGTALVGVLNPFWQEKGYVTPAEYSHFCNSTVPLARMKKFIFKNSESLEAEVEVAHYGNVPIVGCTPKWKISEPSGKTVKEGLLPSTDIPPGNGTRLGKISVRLDFAKTAQKLVLEIAIGDFLNSWDIWVYPATNESVAGTDKIKVVHLPDASTLKFIEDGGTVLLTLKQGTLSPEMGGSIKTGFSSIFWNTAWTGGQGPHTLGILVNPLHPALADFPTEYYSNWQWWDAMNHGQAMNLAKINADLKPVVRVIDDWVTNRPLALIFEAKMGKGKIMVSSIDLITDLNKRPEAQQLLFSLKKYLAGTHFKPVVEVSSEQLKALVKAK